MSDYPRSANVLRRVTQRLWAARVGRATYGSCLILAGIYGGMLLLSRLTGLIPDWFSLPAVVMLPLLALLGTLVALRRPSPEEAARWIDAHEGTEDLFLTLTMLDRAAGEYKPLVARDAEAKASTVQPTAVVPWNWARPAMNISAVLALLVVASLFVPALDPFGRVAAAKEAAQRQDELIKSRRATEVRRSELAKSDLEAHTSEEVERSLEEFKASLTKMEPKNREENARVLAGHQKVVGEKWRMGAEQLKDLLSRKPMQQRFGTDREAKAHQWAENLRKGSTDELEEELDELQQEIENLAQMDDPLQRTEAMRRISKKLDDLRDFAREDVNSRPLAAALERAMKELEAAKSQQGKLSEEQKQALRESIRLAELELKQLAQSVRDMQELEKALEVMQMAKRLNNDEQLDGEACRNCQSLADYRELYAEMMAELGYDLAALEENPDGGPGQGAGEPEAEDESVKTEFQDETSKSAIRKGKILLSLKTKGVTEDDGQELQSQYRAIISDLRQSVSEAIDQEQIPPGYHEGIKRYFDSLDETAPNGDR